VTETPEDPAPTVYAIRFSARADQDVRQAVARLAELTGDVERARAWRDRLLDTVGTLATNPRIFAVHVPASRRFGHQTRRLLFRSTSGSAAYHVYYAVEEKSAESQEGPRVTVLHVRHAARRPITREEARQILANQ